MTDIRRDSPRELVIPVVEEEAVVRKRAVETGRVRIHSRVEEREAWVRETLVREGVEIERIPINREVDRIPDVRREGETLIVPVVEEVVVVEKRLMLVEEVRVHRRRESSPVDAPVRVRRTRVEVERDPTTPRGDDR